MADAFPDKGQLAEGRTVTWAPTHICYGDNNRSAMLRLPQSRKAIENRAADMCLNAYLALAMTSAASLKGIAECLDPGPPINTGVYEVTPREFENSGITPLPDNLLEAIRRRHPTTTMCFSKA